MALQDIRRRATMGSLIFPHHNRSGYRGCSHGYTKTRLLNQGEEWHNIVFVDTSYKTEFITANNNQGMP